MNTQKIASFALDPTLPWLFSDRKMQEPSAFRGMKTVTLNDETYEPMGQYFPAGTQLAMQLVTSLDQLTEGAAYWHEWGYYEESLKKVVTRHSFGRYAGPAYPESKSARRRWEKGDAHIILESDVLDCDLKSYCLHEDGTHTVFVNTSRERGPATHTLYRITHYISLPAPILAGLGTDAIKQSGLTLRQATWLKQESELRHSSYELTMRMQGGLDLPDYRVVLPHEQLRDFLLAQESCHLITASQARKCKSGVLVITLRHSNNGTEFCLTEHYKLHDAAILIDWMRHHSDLQATALNAAVSRQTIGHIANEFRAKQKAADQAAIDAQASQAAAIRGLSVRPQEEYEQVQELAHAA